MASSTSAKRLAEALQSLNAQQRSFVLHLLCDPQRNAARAHRAAGYAAKSPRVRAAAATRLLRRVNIAAAIAAADEPIAERLLVTVERLERERARIAFADMRSVASWGEFGVTLRDSEDIDDDTAAAISEIVIDVRDEASDDGVRRTVTKTRIKLHDKQAALSALEKRHRFYEPPAEHGSERFDWVLTMRGGDVENAEDDQTTA